MTASPNIALLPVNGDLDVTTVRSLRATLDALIDSGCRRIVLNMAACDFVDSAGMGLIIAEIRRMRSVGGLLSLTNVSPRVMRALRIARVSDFAPVSGVEDRAPVEDLDPAVLPAWRRTLRIDPDHLGASRGQVEDLVSRMRLTRDEAFDLTLAVGEAMGNAIDHTDGLCSLVTVSCYDDRVVVEVTDCGRGIEVGRGQEPAPESGSAERGRGIRLMRLLADEVSIERRSGGRGTCVRITKLLDQPGAQLEV